MNKRARIPPTSGKKTDQNELSFEVREVSGRAYVVVKEMRKGSVKLQQSMTFESQTEFDNWCTKERRRLEFPLVYDQLARSVSAVFNRRDGEWDGS